MGNNAGILSNFIIWCLRGIKKVLTFAGVKAAECGIKFFSGKNSRLWCSAVGFLLFYV